MATTFHLTDGRKVEHVNTYAKNANKGRYSVFYGVGEHTYVSVLEVERIEDVPEPRPRRWYDLPIARSAWEGDARDLRA